MAVIQLPNVGAPWSGLSVPRFPSIAQMEADINAISLTITGRNDFQADVYPWYNVKEIAYGAKGDGLSDDTTMLLLAQSAASANGGGTVFLPPGVFLVSNGGSGSDAIGMASNVRWVGSGVGITTIKLMNSGEANVFSGSGVLNAGISDMTIDGNVSNNTAANSGIKLIGGCSDIRLSDLHVHSTVGRGIDISDTSNNQNRIWCRSVRIQNPGSDGLFFRGTSASSVGLFVNDVIVDNPGAVSTNTSKGGVVIAGRASLNGIQVINLNATSKTHAGIKFAGAVAGEAGSVGSSLTNFSIEGTGNDTRGLYVEGSENHIFGGRIRVSGVNSRPIWIDAQPGFSASFNSIRAAHVTGGALCSIEADGGQNTISGCYFKSTTSHGLVVNGGTANRIIDCTFEANAGSGILVTGTGVARTVIQGNFLGGIASQPAIQIDAASTSAGVLNNVYSSNGTNILDNGTTTVLFPLVTGGHVLP